MEDIGISATRRRRSKKLDFLIRAMNLPIISYLFFLSVSFIAVTYFIVHHALASVTEGFSFLHDSDKMIENFFSQYLFSTQWILLGVASFFLISLLLVTYYHARRYFLGLEVIRLHIESLSKKEYSKMIDPNKAGIFKDLALDLNHLTTILKEESKDL